MKTFAFIDASNLFYGGEKSLGWKIDYKKLAEYLKEKYNISQIFYFGGVEIHNFEYQWRRDKLKGPAILAQELYGLCDVLYEITELVSNEKLPPLPEYVYGDIRPYMMDKAEYASGTDIETIKVAHTKLKKWVNVNKALLSELASISDEGKLILTKIDKQLSEAEQSLIKYGELYGDRRYVGSTRFVYPEEKLKLDNLDQETKKWVDMIMVQRDGFNEKDRDRELEVKVEITRAIEHRLDELARLVSGPAFQISNAFWPLHYKIMHEKEMSEPKLWMNFEKDVDRGSPDYAKKRVQFWSKELKLLQKPYDDKLKEIDNAQKELHSIGRETMLVYCADCRKKLVLLHHGYNDQQVSSEAVCDNCFESVANNALEASRGRWNQIKYGEWKCYCGKLLYKFALGNIISLWTEGGVPIKVELPYGKAVLEAKCPDCGDISQKDLDWGWQS